MTSSISELLDDEGYLRNLSDWSEDIAEHLAQEKHIQLTPEHWEIIYLLRRFYQNYEHSPAMRPLCKAVALDLGAEKGKSLHLLKLFPGSPAKVAACLAGLPKPDNCL
ncbi:MULTISPECIES: TusE/DsrC/DsvC family sulfur relay protein [Nitrincola]|uniref:Sulfurtransferase n=1 Tax=Nitrincola nitratireducens TaxID=1229521 RepID=W9V5J9_9GAMM|nr:MULTISPECIES: TusE/DsrC/DsvC family sulfur relay protein [Nitrincola]EXJ11372.1 Sulfurtransferase TusE [Nitrincola nitratireducens]